MSGLGVFESIVPCEADPGQEEVEALNAWMEPAMTEHQDDCLCQVADH